MPTTLIYKATIPVSQAQGAAGSTIDHLVDYAGDWQTNSVPQMVKAVEEYSAATILGTPQSGTAPGGGAWSQANQAVLVKFRAVAGDDFAVALNYTGDGATTTGANGIRVGPSDGTALAAKLFSNFGAYALYQATSYGGLTVGAEYILTAATQVVTATTINLYVQLAAAASPTSILAKAGALLTVPSAFTAGGGAGLQCDMAGAAVDDFEYYSYGGAISASGASSTATLLPGSASDLTAPTASLVAVGTTTATLAISACTSTTGPITYQALSGTATQLLPAYAPAGSPSSALASGTAPANVTLAGLAPGTWYFLGASATDSFSPTPAVRYSRSVAVRTYAHPPIAILFTGDSITSIAWPYSDRDHTTPTTIIDGPLSLTLAQLTVDYLRGLLDRDVVFVDSAVAGAAAGDWLPAGGYYTSAVSAMNSAIAAASYSGPVYVSNMLGANDAFTSVPASTYQSNTAARLSALVALGWTPIEHYPSFVADGAVSGLGSPISQGAVASAYPPALAAAVASVPGSHLGDTSEGTRGQFALDSAIYQLDGCHPLLRGLAGLARAHAEGIAGVVNPAATGAIVKSGQRRRGR